MNDRIKLAEAMGGPLWDAYIDPMNHPECVDLPDPFTDANDDYAVLEWMRKGKDAGKDIGKFEMWLAEGGIFKFDYQIGDYARAALKVLKGEQ